jgi:hypothetical protein
MFFMINRGRGWVAVGAQTTTVNAVGIAQLKPRAIAGV